MAPYLRPRWRDTAGERSQHGLGLGKGSEGKRASRGSRRHEEVVPQPETKINIDVRVERRGQSRRKTKMVGGPDPGLRANGRSGVAGSPLALGFIINPINKGRSPGEGQRH